MYKPELCKYYKGENENWESNITIFYTPLYLKGYVLLMYTIVIVKLVTAKEF